MPQRFNIYAFQHKALRHFFGEINSLCSATNFSNKEEIEFLKERMLQLMSLLASHSFIEEQLILKALEEKGELTVSDPHDHQRLDSIIFKIISGLQSLTNETEKLTEKGANLYLLFTQFHGEYLIHMHQEEVITLPLILERLNEDEITDLSSRIYQKTPEKLMYEWMRYAIPALHPSERIEVLKPVLDQSIPITISNTLSIAKKELTPEGFTHLIHGLNLKMV